MTAPRVAATPPSTTPLMIHTHTHTMKATDTTKTYFHGFYSWMTQSWFVEWTELWERTRGFRDMWCERIHLNPGKYRYDVQSRKIVWLLMVCWVNVTTLSVIGFIEMHLCRWLASFFFSHPILALKKKRRKRLNFVERKKQQQENGLFKWTLNFFYFYLSMFLDTIVIYL